jgi:hypothetical protein
MKSDRVIESAIRAAQNLLWQNLPPTHNLPDAAAVARLRDLVRSPAVKTVATRSMAAAAASSFWSGIFGDWSERPGEGDWT